MKIITKSLYGITLTSGEAIAAESRTFEARLRFGNVDYSGIYSFAYTSYISPQKFTLGSTSSAMFNCETTSFKSGSASALKGQVFTAIISIVGSNESIGLGEFKITEVTEKDGIFSITAYDKMYFVKEKPYVPTFKNKQPLFNVFNDICTQIDNEGTGNGFKKTNPVSFSDTATIDPSVLSGYPLKEALGYLCAYAGRNCVVNRSGAFEARKFTAYKNYQLLNDDRIEMPEIGESDLEIKSLTAVVSDSDVLLSGSSEVGTLNFVCPIMTQSRLDNLYSKDFALTSNAVHTFRIGKIIQILGDPRLEVGDTIPLSHNGKVYNIPIMMIKMEFDGGLMSEIESYGFEEDSGISLAQKMDLALKKTKTEVSKYAQASSELSGVIAGGLGLYKTEIADESGAKRIYMHDKPKLEESSYIATFNSAGFAWTVSGWNGGSPQWSNGVDTVTSNMVMRTISAHKINADMISVNDLSALNATIGGFKIGETDIWSEYNTATGTIKSGMGVYQGSGSDPFLYCIERGNGYVNIPFLLTHDGALLATNAVIGGSIYAIDGTIAGFCIAGNNTASNGFWSNSISSIIQTDKKILDSDHPEYAVFLRGQSVDDDDNLHGAYKPTNIVIGVKKRTDSSQTWNNATYTFSVSAMGKLVATNAEIRGIFTCEDETAGEILEVKNGYLNLSSKVGSSTKEAGSIFSSIISGFDKQKPFLCISTDLTTGAGIYISAQSGMGYIAYRNSPTSNSGVISDIVHRFYGNVQFENTIYTLGSACAKDNFVLTTNSKCLYGTQTDGSTTMPLICVNRYNNVAVSEDGTTRKLWLYGREINSSVSISVGSDRRIKNDIARLDEKYEKFFNLLESTKFKYKNGQSGRFHLGFIAQDVLTALEKSGLTSMDFAGYVETESSTECLKGQMCALRYDEFIALNTHMIQKCLKEISDLKAQLQNLKQKG